MRARDSCSTSKYETHALFTPTASSASPKKHSSESTADAWRRGPRWLESRTSSCVRLHLPERRAVTVLSLARIQDGIAEAGQVSVNSAAGTVHTQASPRYGLEALVRNGDFAGYADAVFVFGDAREGLLDF